MLLIRACSSTWQRIYLRKGVGQRRDRLFAQVEDRLVGGVPKWLWQSLKLVPGSVWEAKDPVTHRPRSGCLTCCESLTSVTQDRLVLGDKSMTKDLGTRQA